MSPAAPSASPTVVDAPTPDAGARALAAKGYPLPGATPPALVDYIAYEPGRARIWVPVAATGSVAVFDVATQTFERIDGFATIEREAKGGKRRLGPNAISFSADFGYVGDRASNEICPVDRKTLKPSRCLKLPSLTDGVSYVASAKEVWVTTPTEHTVTVLDASSPSHLKVKTSVKTVGEPEGYAVDDAHGRFFTNLEDTGDTLVVDIPTHRVKASWHPSCGPAGPRGLVHDAAHDFVIVACTDHLQVLDAGHEGALLGKLETGGGVDNIDLVAGKVYVASGTTAKLTIASVDDKGQLTVASTVETSKGARNAVADPEENVYVADSQGARLLVVKH